MIEVYIDGASKGDPGPSGVGIYFKNVREEQKIKIPLGEMNNHEAEFHALIHALSMSLERNYKVVSIRTDSQAVDQAVAKQFAKREPYMSLLSEALSLMERFDLCFVKWIPKKENRIADQLAKEAIHLN